METAKTEEKLNFKDVYQYRHNFVYEVRSVSGQAKDFLCIKPQDSEPFFFTQSGTRVEAERIVYNERVKVEGFMPLDLYQEKHGEFWLSPDTSEESMESVDTDVIDKMIAKRFGPSVKLSESSQLKVNTINEMVMNIANFFQEHCPNSHEKGTAITFLNIAKMNAVASIANEEKVISKDH